MMKREKVSKTIVSICIAGLILASAGTADAEPVLLGEGGILDTLYGIDNVLEIEIDQLWTNSGSGSATAEAKWAAYNQNFGYLVGASGDTFESLFTVSASGYLDDTISAILSEPETGTIFRFADDPSGAPLWSCRVSDNSDDADHMMTFLVTGGASVGNYVICWEDMPGLGDRDYQDLIVEVSGVSPIPEPATVALLGIGSLLLLRRQRKLRKA